MRDEMVSVGRMACGSCLSEKGTGAMTLDTIRDWFNYYLYNETELFIWAVIGTLAVIAIGVAIYSVNFRKFLAIMIILAVAIIWLANNYLFPPA